MKRRKDSGFTLIELMIVIAVIGILAIVLVPKVGTVKTQAKEAGLDTNIRLVQGYMESKIDKWVSKSSADTNVVNDIKNAFTGGNKELTNPIKSVTAPAASGLASAITGNPPLYIIIGDTYGDIVAGNSAGSIIVEIAESAPITSVTIHAHDSNGVEITEKKVVVTP